MAFTKMKQKMQEKSVLARITAGFLAVILLLVALLSGTIGSTYADIADGKILSFERVNPVYTESVDIGTTQEELDLPATLRAVCEIKEESADADAEMDASGFKQTAPVPDAEGDYDYYWYGYVAPENAEELREAGELVIYTIYYADGQEAYRVHGTYNDKNESFYACDKDGEISGIVVDVPVTWSGEYKAEETDTYTFTAKAVSMSFDGDLPTAEITVWAESEEVDEDQDHEHDDCSEEVECTCDTDTDKHNESCDLYTPECTCDHADTGHVRGCPLWNQECICPEGTFGHISEDCPYWVPLADCDCGIDADSRPWEHLTSCKYYNDPVCICKGGEHDPTNTGCLKHVKTGLFSINGGGAADIAGDTVMRNNTPTTGNANYNTAHTSFTIPGSWKNYINTIWMNKGYNKFTWTPSEQTGAHVYNGVRWKWGGTTATAAAGATTTNADSRPAAVSGVWTVYSGEQLYYALNTFTSGQTIRLGANIDMNGSEYGSHFSTGAKKLIFDGNGKTIYNGGVASDTTNSNVSWLYNTAAGVEIKNVTFQTFKLVHSKSAGWGQAHILSLSGGSAVLSDVGIKKTLIYSLTGYATPVYMGSGSIVKNVLFDGCYIYVGNDHGSSGFCSVNASTIENSASNNALLATLGGHSGGFATCGGIGVGSTATNCFINNIEAYVTAQFGTFSGYTVAPGGTVSTIKNCFSSGRVEGYRGLGGFFGVGTSSNTANTGKIVVENCYSTVNIGIRSGGYEIGGFYDFHSDGAAVKTESVMTNTYAAGEVSSLNAEDMATNPNYAGGYVGYFPRDSALQTTNCYYDKQTTAMREKAIGRTDITWAGITGVLTSTTGKSGTGLASGTYGGASDIGFRGFSNNSEWDFREGYYPQLKVFSEATKENWGSQELADMVRACSLASVSTVILNTWDSGYDWDDTGVRTTSLQSYDRTLASTGKTTHKGNRLSYDTVREIVTDFEGSRQVAWEHAAETGRTLPARQMIGSIFSDVENTIIVNGSKFTVDNPGMDWVTATATVNGQTGKRYLRVISHMALEAGQDKTVTAGAKYNHRSDVSFKMIDDINADLVLGLDDNECWSTSIVGGYTNTSKFWAVPMDHMETSTLKSKKTLVYTEIWRAKKDSSGNYVLDANGDYVPEYSVNVTGPDTGNNSTIDEQKWNGGEPLYADTSVGHKYIITYYWMLADGRYRSDDKIVTIVPGEYDVTVNVYNAGDNTANSTALYTGAAPDSGANTAYSFGGGTSAHAETLDNTYTTNVTAAWKKDIANTKITKMAVTMTALDGTTVMGKKAITGDIKAGDTITIPIKYLYLTTIDDPSQGKREVTKQETVNITYTIETDPSGGYYLRFNKLANVPSNEVPSAYEHGDIMGIPAGTKAYINDLTYNIQIDLYVEEVGELRVKKVLTAPAEEEETFVFQVDYCGSGENVGDVKRSMYAVITIPAGQAQGTAEFVGMPAGWYTVTELSSNWRFEMLTGKLDDSNPGAEIDAGHSAVTRWIEGQTGGYTFWNKRLDVPWANGKGSVTNDMPSVDKYE